MGWPRCEHAAQHDLPVGAGAVGLLHLLPHAVLALLTHAADVRLHHLAVPRVGAGAEGAPALLAVVDRVAVDADDLHLVTVRVRARARARVRVS